MSWPNILIYRKRHIDGGVTKRFVCLQCQLLNRGGFGLCPLVFVTSLQKAKSPIGVPRSFKHLPSRIEKPFGRRSCGIESMQPDAGTNSHFEALNRRPMRKAAVWRWTIARATAALSPAMTTSSRYEKVRSSLSSPERVANSDKIGCNARLNNSGPIGSPCWTPTSEGIVMPS